MRLRSSLTYSFQCDIAAVEVERANGRVHVRRYVTMHDAGTMLNPTIVEGQIAGGSVQAGDHQSSLREFAKRNREVLERVPSAFFSVSLANADSDEDSEAESHAVIEKFVAETGWRPQRIERIAGALVYTQYNIFVRHLMKLIARSHGRTELDISHDFDFTDWPAVERFAVDFARSVAEAGEASVA